MSLFGNPIARGRALRCLATPHLRLHQACSSRHRETSFNVCEIVARIKWSAANRGRTRSYLAEQLTLNNGHVTQCRSLNPRALPERTPTAQSYL